MKDLLDEGYLPQCTPTGRASDQMNMAAGFVEALIHARVIPTPHAIDFAGRASEWGLRVADLACFMAQRVYDNCYKVNGDKG